MRLPVKAAFVDSGLGNKQSQGRNVLRGWRFVHAISVSRLLGRVFLCFTLAGGTAAGLWLSRIVRRATRTLQAPAFDLSAAMICLASMASQHENAAAPASPLL